MGATGFGVLLSITAALLLLAVGLAYANLTHDLPNIDYLPILLSPPNGMLLQPTRVYDRSGQHLLLSFAPTDEPRRYIPLNPQIPQHLPEALAKAAVAMMDPTFWSNPGYDLRTWNNPAAHPTLAQRLVSDMLLYNEQFSVRRALRERLLAAQSITTFGRGEILEWTLNSADYGNDAFGAEAAAQLYFGKPAIDLTLGESAMLAATMHDPSLNPIDAPDTAVERRDKLLELMQQLGMISGDEEAQAAAETYRAPAPTPAAEPTTAPAFLHLVRSQLDQQFTRERIERGGVIITTTLDYDLQQAAACTALAFARRLEGGADPSTPCQAADLLPALAPDVQLAQPSVSAVIIDPQTGEVLSAVGETANDAETQSLGAHDPGSLMYPFVYLSAFTRGFSPASLVWDIPPGDADPGPGSQYRGPVRMRMALVNDYRVPAQSVAQQMGDEAISRTESSFGLRGGSETLLDLAGAYGVFAASGVKYGQPGPSAVLKVEGIDHTTWLDLQTPQTQPILAAPLAYIMNNVLSDENAREPSLGNPNPTQIQRPAGLKTGKAEDGKNLWTVGYTPSRVAAVWLGSQEADTTLPQSPRVAASLWSALIQVATQSLPRDGWLVPAGVTAVDVCDPSGMLPTKDCPSTVSEVFLNGNEPVQADTLYRSFAVNRETGLLATVYTPQQLVENRVYMVLPPEAQAWGKWANIPTAPTTYDAIQARPVDPEVRINAPAMFDEVSGQVQIRGTASGQDFERYRVLVGQGINPQEWTAVGEESTTPIENGLLASWDTSGLRGLYAVQLQVIRSDQRVDTAIIQVTIRGE
jgi:membrane peptidoglycan carboxypeptidase